MAWLSAIGAASTAWAGMPSPLPGNVARVWRLTDSAHARYEAISFFIVVLLGSAVVVRWLWNALARDFPRMPRLTYGKALAVVGLWGLLFLVVLTMIATTRELMMPGVWEKKGLLYHVAGEPPQSPADSGRTAELSKQPEPGNRP